MKVMTFAADIDWAIGNSVNENGLPWGNIPEDFQHFKEKTKRYVRIVMGRLTYEAIVKYNKGKPLPDRESIILSQTLTEPPYPGVKVFGSIGEILDYLGEKDFSVIGGAKTNESFIPYVDQIFLTKVHDHHAADCWFKKELLADFYEDGALRETLRASSDKLPLVTLHTYKRHIPM